MNTMEITIVRVYLIEAQRQLKPLLKRLNDWGKTKGVAVFKGTAGFGYNGMRRSVDLLDNSDESTLPTVVEFFDDPTKVTAVLDYLEQTVKPGYIVYWNASVSARAFE
ncbi:MAG: DUF190 domain-containing protein [Gammaproteobacteria bacterium]|nr:DUF190 domain-containing protein [Gammaproteobacteria bacterium]